MYTPCPEYYDVKEVIHDTQTTVRSTDSSVGGCAVRDDAGNVHRVVWHVDCDGDREVLGILTRG
jgi:hypothetical protein